MELEFLDRDSLQLTKHIQKKASWQWTSLIFLLKKTLWEIYSNYLLLKNETNRLRIACVIRFRVFRTIKGASNLRATFKEFLVFQSIGPLLSTEYWGNDTVIFFSIFNKIIVYYFALCNINLIVINLIDLSKEDVGLCCCRLFPFHCPWPGIAYN